MKIYLDDIRICPYDDKEDYPCERGWVTVRDGASFKLIVSSVKEPIEEISFDNDLGFNEPEGWELANWLFEQIREGNIPKPESFSVHSANPVASKRIQATLDDIVKWEENS